MDQIPEYEMPLTSDLRGRLQDCHLLVESARKTLAGIEQEKLPEVEEIRKCFESAVEALTKALSH